MLQINKVFQAFYAASPWDLALVFYITGATIGRNNNQSQLGKRKKHCASIYLTAK